jgi:hypothetical protein
MTHLSRLCLALCLSFTVPATQADDTAAATWQHQQFTFEYRGFTTHYSCDGLHSRLRQVLLALGVRKDDLKITPALCSRLAGRPELTPSYELDLWTLQPAATPPPADALPAQWHEVRLSRELDSGDCELAEEIRRQVLPHFSVRKVQLHTSCIPHQASTGSPSFSLEALAAAPKP